MTAIAGGGLVRSGFKSRTKPMARSGALARSPFTRKPSPPGDVVAPVPRLRARQRAPTKPEKLLWRRMVQQVGCIACRLDGHHQPLVSIHHIDGRTKPGCHGLVLPLCAGHHQDGTGADKTLIAVHPYKARFEQRYGSQMALLALVHHLLLDAGTP